MDCFDTSRTVSGLNYIKMKRHNDKLFYYAGPQSISSSQQVRFWSTFRLRNTWG